MAKDTYLLMVVTASAFVVAFLFFPVLIKLLSGWKVFDAPGKHKIHKHYVPAMGGICIVLGAGFSLLIGLKIADWVTYKYFFIAMALIFIVGMRDDILTLTPGEKLAGQVLPVIILVVFGDTQLLSFYGIFQNSAFPMPVAWLVTVFTIVILTNAYNLIDGIDGLAASVAVLALTGFGTWLFLAGEPRLALVALSFAGATLAFLCFNWQPSRIFMGDTGALTIGLALSFLAVKFINLNYALPPGHPVKFESSIGTAVCVLIIPIFDTFRVIFIRLGKLQSPFKADTNHVHHGLLSLGLSHAQAVSILAFGNIAFLLVAFALRNHHDLVILPIVALICVAMHVLIRIARRRYSSRTQRSE